MVGTYWVGFASGDPDPNPFASKESTATTLLLAGHVYAFLVTMWLSLSQLSFKVRFLGASALGIVAPVAAVLALSDFTPLLGGFVSGGSGSGNQSATAVNSTVNASVTLPTSNASLAAATLVGGWGTTMIPELVVIFVYPALTAAGLFFGAIKSAIERPKDHVWIFAIAYVAVVVPSLLWAPLLLASVELSVGAQAAVVGVASVAPVVIAFWSMYKALETVDEEGGAREFLFNYAEEIGNWIIIISTLVVTLVLLAVATFFSSASKRAMVLLICVVAVCATFFGKLVSAAVDSSTLRLYTVSTALGFGVLPAAVFLPLTMSFLSSGSTTLAYASFAAATAVPALAVSYIVMWGMKIGAQGLRDPDGWSSLINSFCCIFLLVPIGVVLPSILSTDLSTSGATARLETAVMAIVMLFLIFVALLITVANSSFKALEMEKRAKQAVETLRKKVRQAFDIYMKGDIAREVYDTSLTLDDREIRQSLATKQWVSLFEDEDVLEVVGKEEIEQKVEQGELVLCETCLAGELDGAKKLAGQGEGGEGVEEKRAEGKGGEENGEKSWKEQENGLQEKTKDRRGKGWLSREGKHLTKRCPNCYRLKLLVQSANEHKAELERTKALKAADEAERQKILKAEREEKKRKREELQNTVAAGTAAVEREDWEKVVECSKKALELLEQPTYEIYFMLARAHLETGNLLSAVHAAEECRRLLKSQWAPFIIITRAHLANGNLKLADAALLESCAAFPDSQDLKDERVLFDAFVAAEQHARAVEYAKFVNETWDFVISPFRAVKEEADKVIEVIMNSYRAVKEHQDRDAASAVSLVEVPQQPLVTVEPAIGLSSTEYRNIVNGLRSRGRKAAAHFSKGLEELKNEQSSTVILGDRTCVLELHRLEGIPGRVGALSRTMCIHVHLPEEQQREQDGGQEGEQQELRGKKKQKKKKKKTKKLKNARHGVMHLTRKYDVIRKVNFSSETLTMEVEKSDGTYPTLDFDLYEMRSWGQDLVARGRITGKSSERFATKMETVPIDLFPVENGEDRGKDPFTLWVQYTLIFNDEAERRDRQLAAVIIIQRRLRNTLFKYSFEERRIREMYMHYTAPTRKATHFHLLQPRKDSSTPVKLASSVVNYMERRATGTVLKHSMSRKVMTKDQIKRVFSDMKLDEEKATKHFTNAIKRQNSQLKRQHTRRRRKNSIGATHKITYKEFKKIFTEMAMEEFPGVEKKRALKLAVKKHMIKHMSIFQDRRKVEEQRKSVRRMDENLGLAFNFQARSRMDHAIRLLQKKWREKLKFKEIQRRAATLIATFYRRRRALLYFRDTAKTFLETVRAARVVQRLYRRWKARREMKKMRLLAEIGSLTKKQEKKEEREREEKQQLEMLKEKQSGVIDITAGFGLTLEEEEDDDDDDDDDDDEGCAKDEVKGVKEREKDGKGENGSHEHEEDKKNDGSAIEELAGGEALKVILEDSKDPLETEQRFRKYLEKLRAERVKWGDIAELMSKSIIKSKKVRRTRRQKVDWENSANWAAVYGLGYTWYSLATIALSQGPIADYLSSISAAPSGLGNFSNFSATNTSNTSTASSAFVFALGSSLNVSNTSNTSRWGTNATNATISPSAAVTTTLGLDWTAWFNAALEFAIKLPQFQFGDDAFPIYFWTSFSLALFYPLFVSWAVQLVQEGMLGLDPETKKPAKDWSWRQLYAQAVEMFDSYLFLGMTLTFVGAFSCDFSDPNAIVLQADRRVQCFSLSDPTHLIYMACASFAMLTFFPLG